MESLDFTKDKDKDTGDVPLSQQAVYLPDPTVRITGDIDI